LENIHNLYFLSNFGAVIVSYSFIYSNSRLTIQHIRSIVTSGVTIEICKTHGMLCMTSSITMVTTNTTYQPRCIQVKLTEISYIRTLFYKVWFIQNSVLFRVGFKQFSLYHILRWTNFIKYKISLIYLIRIIPRSWSSIG
jgi:hypothetical protein